MQSFFWRNNSKLLESSAVLSEFVIQVVFTLKKLPSTRWQHFSSKEKMKTFFVFFLEINSFEVRFCAKFSIVDVEGPFF